MSSTRNRNTPGDYKLEQAWNTNNSDYLSRPYYGRIEQTFLAGNGLLVGKVYHSELVGNGIDVESTLYGIGSTNLTGESFDAIPRTKTLPVLNITEWRPVVTQIPEALVVQPGQRPYPMK